MSLPPVTPKRIGIASKTLANADVAAVACRQVGLPFWVACALLEQESGGKNIYGHDPKGVFSVDGQDIEVTPLNFAQFLVQVLSGRTSNGVGPCQITYAGTLILGRRDGGMFRQMLDEGLAPWEPHDNMLYGFRHLVALFDNYGTWERAGAIYNGGPNPNLKAQAYGRELTAKAQAWKSRLGLK